MIQTNRDIGLVHQICVPEGVPRFAMCGMIDKYAVKNNMFNVTGTIAHWYWSRNKLTPEREK